MKTTRWPSHTHQLYKKFSLTISSINKDVKHWKLISCWQHPKFLQTQRKTISYYLSSSNSTPGYIIPYSSDSQSVVCSRGITWELARNANSQGPIPDIQNQTLCVCVWGGWSPANWFNKPSGYFSWAAKVFGETNSWTSAVAGDTHTEGSKPHCLK